MSADRSGESDIDFVVAGGARYGMGHVMRSGTLAAAAAGRGWRVRAFLAGDRTAEQAWRDRCPGSNVTAWTAWRARRSAPVTLFDHPFSKSRWLAACPPERTHSVVLDDERAVGRARLTINPALHHAPDEETARSGPPAPASRPAEVLSGPRYAILDPVHRGIRHAPLSARRTLLVSLGGADPHHATPRLAPILARVLERVGPSCGIEARHVVLGPAFADPDERIRRALAAAAWRVERALKPAAMAASMATARLAVVGFGTSLTELAWHGTPHLSLTHHDADVPRARTLERRGIGRWLGSAARIDPDEVATRFEAALRDLAWQSDSAARARDALEGARGVERILDRIAPWIVAARSTQARRPRAQSVGAGGVGC
ncbi:MAG: hypothetical protein R3F35_00505 [Myxococcota bacterium]